MPAVWTGVSVWPSMSATRLPFRSNAASVRCSRSMSILMSCSLRLVDEALSLRRKARSGLGTLPTYSSSGKGLSGAGCFSYTTRTVRSVSGVRRRCLFQNQWSQVFVRLPARLEPGPEPAAIGLIACSSGLVFWYIKNGIPSGGAMENYRCGWNALDNYKLQCSFPFSAYYSPK